MSEQHEWRQWSESWQRQPVVDVRRLQRQVRHKRWRMIAMVALETLLLSVVTLQIALFMHRSALGLRWNIFCVGAMALLTVQWSLNQWLRRRTWRASGESVAALLRLAERRALAGIRLTKLGLWALAVLMTLGVVLAWPQLQPVRWEHDPGLRQLLVVQIALNTPVVLVGVGYSLWYIRRQRRRLARIAHLRDEQEAPD